MRRSAILVRSVFVLCALSGTAPAEVTVSLSNDPNAGFAGDLRRLLNAEREALHAAPPVAARQSVSVAPELSPRPRRRANPHLFDPGWLASMPPAAGGAQWQCLTEALYFEARGESPRGQFAVAEVILNRVRSPRYPDTVCDVVREGQGRRGACQFSYVCDGKPEVVAEPAAWEQVGKIARLTLDGEAAPVTMGATHFHTLQVRPTWAQVFPKTAQIGTHVFYRQPGATPGFGNRVDPATGKAKAQGAERTARLGTDQKLDLGL